MPDLPGLKNFVASEIALIVITGVFALLGMRGVFAFMSMMNVLTPLWAIVGLLAVNYTTAGGE